ncbi:MAG: methyltransferase domain-containing protein, partial [Sphingobacteriales bacterium]
MNSKLTNTIRHILDEWLPPFIRDSRWFMYPFYYLAYRGRNIKAVMNFKQNYFTWNENELRDFYANLNSISRNRKTDLTEKCFEMLLKQLDGEYRNVLDVGCSSGYVLSRIHEVYPELSLTGIDFIAGADNPEIRFVNADVRTLPFENRSFDVVICSHTIEHIFELHDFIDELKRVTRKKLIVVTPKQRYYFYSLDEHLQFFPQREQLTTNLDFERFTCENVEGDWFFVG